MNIKKYKAILLYLLAVSLVQLSISFSHGQQSCRSVFVVPGRSEIGVVSPSVKKVMNHLDDNIKDLFSTSGFKNEAEIIEAARIASGKTGRMYRSAWYLLREENILVGTRLPEKIRSQVVQKGFLNLHQAKDSQGASGDRNHVEASYSNMSQAEWKKILDEDKPKYAALYPKHGMALQSPKTLDTYAGSDVYFYKTEKVRERMTVTAGDSLNRFVNYHGYWTSEYRKPESWDQVFVPWKSRALFIPILAEGLKEGRVGLPEIQGLEYQKPIDYGMQGEVVGEGPMAPFKMKWVPNMDYIEIQIWGKLTLDDVAIFEFRKDPPTGVFLQELLKRGIEIRDGR